MCRDAYPERSIGLVALLLDGDRYPFHVYASWDGWAFDASGWHAEPLLVQVNEDFEGRPVERVALTVDLAEFCAGHVHRMPHQYWGDPLPRACAYLSHFAPPWAGS
ncbi:hypothetical protein Afe04nite_22990 [Asanoa ferruginea]|uniref:hypothetical protein n=1 Tax=Asanoa ferruginea TaxID=53367 RepID=UPI001A4E984D|nr:hypothetical protein [Asanoa ferruginea]GIF47760.1 hypothetical protein Afe04nite_22990 [Asanoa ferruginea]